MNVVAVFPESVAQPSAEDPDLKKTMLEIFEDFSPEVKALTSLADKVMVSHRTSCCVVYPPKMEKGKGTFLQPEQ